MFSPLFFFTFTTPTLGKKIFRSQHIQLPHNLGSADKPGWWRLPVQESFLGQRINTTPQTRIFRVKGFSLMAVELGNSSHFTIHFTTINPWFSTNVYNHRQNTYSFHLYTIHHIKTI